MCDLERPSTLSRISSREDLLKVFRDPNWGLICQLIDRLRLYDEGLAGAFRLENLLDYHSEIFSEKDRNDYFLRVQHLKLNMMDKLDLWEDYLEEWNKLRSLPGPEKAYDNRQSEPFDELITADFQNKPPPGHIEPIEEFTTRVLGNVRYVHFLYGTHTRKELIQRKLERSKHGKQRKSDLHHTRAEFSESEVKDRLAEFKRYVEVILDDLRA